MKLLPKLITAYHFSKKICSQSHLSCLRMGSVLAASAPSPPVPGPGGQGLVSVPPGFTMPSVSPVSAPGSSSAGHQETEPPLPNPGGFEECHRKCKGKHN